MFIILKLIQLYGI